ncbi:hypothetical protein HDU86_005491 [Geranomyces michiganensis]|nr:hypothetical protein HDU86_005491 [Geranomyces michiganensis]
MFATPVSKKVRADEASPPSPVDLQRQTLANLGMPVYDGYQTGAKKPIYGMPSTTDVSPQKPGGDGMHFAYQQQLQQQHQQQQQQQQQYQQQQAAAQPQNSKKRALISDYFAPN